jgi:altronate hydrolase
MNLELSPPVGGLRLLRLHDDDPIAIAIEPLAPGERLAPDGPATTEKIPRGHKVALRPIPAGAAVSRFAQVIGVATADIAAGAHVHSHNLAFRPSAASRAIGTRRRTLAPVPAEVRASFEGFRRADGGVGTRNYVAILTSVNCSATVTRLIAERFRDPAVMRAWPHVDGVIALTHKSGCSVAEGGESLTLLRRTLGGYARHANVGGVLIVGLGCEDNQIDRLLEVEKLAPGDRLRTLVIQEEGGTTATVRAGVALVHELLAVAETARRESVPAAHLMVGLQCGGSDGFSGLSANPALGAAVDLLVRHGGTGILSETPEIYGAENLLLERAASPAVGRKLIDLIAWWEEHLAREPHGFDDNPSPGNRAGGLTTILEKSLGAVAKGGTSDLVEVYRYAEPITTPGFVFMNSPGFDPMSATGQVASGANLICFTTGRGSCFGCRPVPSLKLATNTPLYRRMTEDMDINCGEILDGTADLATMGERIFQAMLAAASGRPTQSEQLGYGEDEFAPWHLNPWF